MLERFLQPRVDRSEGRVLAEPSYPRERRGAQTDSGLKLRFPSLARRIASQHEQLHTLAAMVSSSVERGSLRSARLAFTSFSAALESHMTLEDQTFFPAIRGLSPSLAPHLAQLIAVHAGFRQRLDDLHELLARGSAEEFRRGFDGFCSDFAQHEVREERIVAGATRS